MVDSNSKDWDNCLLCNEEAKLNALDLCKACDDEIEKDLTRIYRRGGDE